MKKLIIAAAMFIITSCSLENKIAIKENKYGPIHYRKYTEINGKLFVNGREVRLIPGTCVYAKK